MRKNHDERYKKVFSNPIFIEKLLTSFVHEDFIADLDFKHLDRIDKSFIDDNLKTKESDLIYKIMYKEKPLYIYVLLEFQSTVDRTMPLRFLRYILELSETYGKNKESGLYPAVFPLLIYNGERRWSAKLNPKDLYEQTIDEKFIPKFEYYPILINEIDKDILLNIHNAVSAMFYIENNLSLEYTDTIDVLIKILHDSNTKELELFKTWFNSVLRDYNLNISENEMERLKKPEEVVHMLEANMKRSIAAVEEKGIEKGIEQGVEQEKKEVALRLMNSGAEMEFVSKITGLAIKELNDLKD